MLEGRLNEFRLGDVFQLLAWTGKSGALTVDAGQRRGRVDFSGGQIAFAIADVRRAELGARLTNAGLVGEDGLRRVVEAQQSGPGRVAAVLLEEGLDEAVVDETLREHIQDAVFTLMRTADGRFMFEPGDDDDASGPRLETEALIAEGARRLEEWEEVRERIPSSGAILAMTPNPPAGNETVTVSADQWRLLVLVDGARSVAEIVELTGQGEFATSQVLAELVEAGLVDAVDPVDGDTGLGQLLARRESLRELEESELGEVTEAPATEPAPAPESDPEPEEAGTDFEAEPEARSEAEPEAGDEAADDEPLTVSEPDAQPAPAFEGEPEPVSTFEPALDGEPDGGPDSEPTEAEVAPNEPQDAVEEAQDDGGEPSGADAVGASRPDVDRAQVARELASLGFEGPPVAPAPPTDEPQRRLTRDEDVTRGLLVRLMDGVRKA